MFVRKQQWITISNKKTYKTPWNRLHINQEISIRQHKTYLTTDDRRAYVSRSQLSVEHIHFDVISAISMQFWDSLKDPCVVLSNSIHYWFWRGRCKLQRSHLVGGRSTRLWCQPQWLSCMLQQTPSQIFLIDEKPKLRLNELNN